MALKIQNEIGCDQGITSEAYVRINTYRIDKQSGNVDLNYSAYFNQDASVQQILPTSPMRVAMNRSTPIKNIKIGEFLSIPLRKDITETITTTEKKPVEKQVTKDVTTTIDGVSTTTTVTNLEMVMEDVPVTNTVTRSVSDLSQLEGVDIFKFCYSKLKEKLLVDFDNIVDC